MKIKNWNKVKTGTMLLVSWDDITDIAGWLDDEDAQDAHAYKAKNIGIFIGNDKTNIKLTWSVGEDGNKSISVIPIGCITNVEELVKKRK